MLNQRLIKAGSASVVQHRDSQPQLAAIVYRLGPMVFIHKSGVRFPVAVQNVNASVAPIGRASDSKSECW